MALQVKRNVRLASVRSNTVSLTVNYLRIKNIKMKIKLILANILFIVCFLLPNVNFAQTGDIHYIDVVHLKDGSEFRGKIIEYKDPRIPFPRARHLQRNLRQSTARLQYMGLVDCWFGDSPCYRLSIQ